MIKKIVIGAILVLALGTTTIAFAKGNSNQRQVNRITDNSMYSMMEQYEYDEIGQDNAEYNYATMNDFMNNLSDEDYQKMKDFMREYGYGNRESMMERFDKEDRITMHNAMGGAAACFR